MKYAFAVFLISLYSAAVLAQEVPVDSPLTQWTPVVEGFVLEPGPPGSWDEHIRERMWVRYEDGAFKAWYCGFEGDYDLNRPNLVHLGYATSPDGIHWTKDPRNPVFAERWTEDPCIVKSDGLYYLYVEDETVGETVIYLLTSPDGVTWTQQGDVVAGVADSGWEGEWVGTATVWKEGAKWFMLYEGGPPGDTALATSTDGKSWVRYEGNPVLEKGPGWDKEITAPDSIAKIDGLYYLFYHAWSTAWQSGLAVSKDLKTWVRYSGNPVFDNPSTVLVELEDRWYAYVMHENREGKNGVLLYESMKKER